VANIYHGYFSGKIFSDMRLDRADPETWYLVGPRERGIKVFYLAGNKAPYLEYIQNSNYDGVQTKIRFDVVTKVIDWRNFVKVTKS
jgi:hypothetical protein